MKIALASARFVNNNIPYNLSQIRRHMEDARQKGADLICFGEAFLQGFDAFSWQYETDKDIAVSTDSALFLSLCDMTAELGVDLLLGFLERDQDTLYSACALISEGRLYHLYRRISPGWKEYSRTDHHYQEGPRPAPFVYKDKICMIALCGDMWDMPNVFAKGEDMLFWPVYVNYTPEEWKNTEQAEYAQQAALACPRTLFINSVDDSAFGGACDFSGGNTAAALSMGTEGILIVET